MFLFLRFQVALLLGTGLVGPLLSALGISCSWPPWPMPGQWKSAGGRAGGRGEISEISV